MFTGNRQKGGLCHVVDNGSIAIAVRNSAFSHDRERIYRKFMLRIIGDGDKRCVAVVDRDFRLCLPVTVMLQYRPSSVLGIPADRCDVTGEILCVLNVRIRIDLACNTIVKMFIIQCCYQIIDRIFRMLWIKGFCVACGIELTSGTAAGRKTRGKIPDGIRNRLAPVEFIFTVVNIIYAAVVLESAKIAGSDIRAEAAAYLSPRAADTIVNINAYIGTSAKSFRRDIDDLIRILVKIDIALLAAYFIILDNGIAGKVQSRRGINAHSTAFRRRISGNCTGCEIGNSRRNVNRGAVLCLVSAIDFFAGDGYLSGGLIDRAAVASFSLVPADRTAGNSGINRAVIIERSAVSVRGYIAADRTFGDRYRSAGGIEHTAVLTGHVGTDLAAGHLKRAAFQVERAAIYGTVVFDLAADDIQRAARHKDRSAAGGRITADRAFKVQRTSVHVHRPAVFGMVAAQGTIYRHFTAGYGNRAPVTAVRVLQNRVLKNPQGSGIAHHGSGSGNVVRAAVEYDIIEDQRSVVDKHISGKSVAPADLSLAFRFAFIFRFRGRQRDGVIFGDDQPVCRGHDKIPEQHLNHSLGHLPILHIPQRRVQGIEFLVFNFADIFRPVVEPESAVVRNVKILSALPFILPGIFRPVEPHKGHVILYHASVIFVNQSSMLVQEILVRGKDKADGCLQ